MILYFPVLFPLQNIFRKFLFASMNVSKVITWRKFKKPLFDCKISGFLKFSTYYFEKLNLFPSKKHLDLLTIERYDIELTNIKILWLRVVCRPLKGNHFYRYFEILLILVWNAEAEKKFQVQNFNGYGNWHHSLTRKIRFRVIS